MNRPLQLALLGILFALPHFAARAEGKPTVEDGAIGPAVYRIVSPPKWNGRLILLAHGLRPDDAPMTAEFDYGPGTALGEMLKDGSIIASTSFRRNGWIVGDAVDDLLALRDKVVAGHGTPAMTLVVGTSMGGAIGTAVAERSNNAKAFQGVLAVAAALGGDGADAKTLSHTPQIPLLFLSNQNETAGPRAYIKAAWNGPVVPVLWTVARDGHANLTQPELLEGIRGLIKFVETGKIAPQRDATIADPTPPSTAAFDGQTAEATVTKIDPVYGNMTTSLVAADLAKLGLREGGQVALRSHSQLIPCRWVHAYADVPQGAWLLFVTADGHVQIARNLANAAGSLGINAGDKLSVSALHDSPQPPASPGPAPTPVRE